MYNAATGWLMTTLDSDPLMVSLVQAATSLPMFLFALPAGALADIIDKRRLVLALEIATTVISAVFAYFVSVHLVTPVVLLVFMFLAATLSAIEAPAWQAIVPQLVSKQDLGSAVAASSVSVNISRAVGPALAGAMIVSLGMASPYWFNAVSNLGIVGVFLWWRPHSERARVLPAERFTNAIRAGFRYARYNQYLRRTLARAMGFFLFASAYWALLPLVARDRLGGGPELYGVLLGAIGLGAVGCVFILPYLKKKLGASGLVTLAELGTAAALALFGIARDPKIAAAASVIAGMSWMAALSSLNVSAQLALPEWVRGRGIAVYVMVFFGTVTIGSIIWGEIAGRYGLLIGHLSAAGCALAAIPLTWRYKLLSGANLDLTPSMHWPEPVLAQSVENDAGPVLVTVQYRIAPKDREAFLDALDKLRRERRRDGAYDWGIFEDAADEGRYLETFLVESWIEHLRQHRRVTNADRVLQEHVHHYLKEPPYVTHFIAAEAQQSRS